MIDVILKIVIIVCLVDFIIIFARLVKPLRNMSGLAKPLQNMFDKVTEESQRIRFEMAKLAEETAVIRKNLQKDSGDQDTDLKT